MVVSRERVVTGFAQKKIACQSWQYITLMIPMLLQFQTQTPIQQSSKHFLFSKMSWRRLQCKQFSSSKLYDVFNTSSRCLQHVFKTSSKTSSRCVCRTSSSRCLQNVFKKTSYNYVLKTSWKTKNVILKTSSLDECLLGTGAILMS